MATEVSPEGGEARGAVPDSTGGGGPGPAGGPGSVVGPGAGDGAAPAAAAASGMGIGADQGLSAGSGSANGVGAKGGSGPISGPGAGADAGGRSAGEGVWDDIVLDEDFIRSAETAEPSARARMLAARWREQAPDPQPWRSDEPPAGWFFSKARRRRWRRR